jgi:hypothetical protein
MKNPHIELVKKWLADPESVSAEELERADVDTYAAASAAYAATTAAAAAAAAAAYAASSVDAKYWIEKYEELTK